MLDKTTIQIMRQDLRVTVELEENAGVVLSQQGGFFTPTHVVAEIHVGRSIRTRIGSLYAYRIDGSREQRTRDLDEYNVLDEQPPSILTDIARELLAENWSTT